MWEATKRFFIDWRSSARCCENLVQTFLRESKTICEAPKIAKTSPICRTIWTSEWLLRSGESFHTILGRGTTLGNAHDPLSSAMRFAGNDMSKHRITNLWSQSDGKPFILATLRKIWVDYLNSNILPPSPLSSSQKSGLFRWSTTTRFTVCQLQAALAM